MKVKVITPPVKPVREFVLTSEEAKLLYHILGGFSDDTFAKHLRESGVDDYQTQKNEEKALALSNTMFDELDEVFFNE